MRGKLGEGIVNAIPERLIPACAGKTTMRSIKTDARGAHPRVCGENLRLLHQMFSVVGSSPRVRGKRLIGAKVDRRRGLIPACAGKTAPVP